MFSINNTELLFAGESGSNIIATSYSPTSTVVLPQWTVNDVTYSATQPAYGFCLITWMIPDPSLFGGEHVMYGSIYSHSGAQLASPF